MPLRIRRGRALNGVPAMLRASRHSRSNTWFCGLSSPVALFQPARHSGGVRRRGLASRPAGRAGIRASARAPCRSRPRQRSVSPVRSFQTNTLDRDLGLGDGEARRRPFATRWDQACSKCLPGLAARSGSAAFALRVAAVRYDGAAAGRRVQPRFHSDGRL